jgi:hypothetical protein
VTATNPINCESTELKFVDDQSAISLNTVTLVPGVGANLTVTVQLATEAIGSPDTASSFDVESVWS